MPNLTRPDDGLQTSKIKNRIRSHQKEKYNGGGWWCLPNDLTEEERKVRYRT